MVIFTSKNNVVTCLSNAQWYKKRVYVREPPTVFSFTPFFTDISISDADRTRLGNEWCKNAMRPIVNCRESKTSFAYLGAFVFIGIMAWRYRAKWCK